MGKEVTVDFINDLISTYPEAADGLSEADDHMRFIKHAIKETFPGAGGQGFDRAILATEDQIDFLAAVVAGTAALSKALVLDSNGDITGINELTATTLIGALTGSISGDAAGNAATATLLETARALNGVDFDGSAAITVPSNVDSINPSDTAMFPLLVPLNSTGNQSASTDSGISYNALNNILTLLGKIAVPNGGLNIGGADVDATAAELNVMDGGTSDSGITLVDADRIVVNDNGVMKQTAMSDVKEYTAQYIPTLVMLDTPEEIYSNSGNTDVPWTTVNMSAEHPASFADGATQLILAVDLTISGNGSTAAGDMASILGIAKSGKTGAYSPGLADVNMRAKAVDVAGVTTNPFLLYDHSLSEIIVDLDGNGDFQVAIDKPSGGSPGGFLFRYSYLRLVGYYK